MWNIGKVVHSTSDSAKPSTRAVFSPQATYCACGHITPLGAPVVPEV